MTYDIGLLLDGLILVFLGVTIFYAARLSLFLKSFREGREGIGKLIRDLSVTIDRAEESIRSMKENAQAAAGGLQEVINESKFLSDELRFMNEAGDGLATRLEKLADRNRELVDLMENSGGIGTQKIHLDISKHEKLSGKARHKAGAGQFEINDFDIDSFDIDEDDEQDFHALSDGAYREEEERKPKVDTAAKSKVRSFAIFDRDYDDEASDNTASGNGASDNGQNDQSEQSEQSEFHSRAEQDLYEALQRKKRVSKVS